MTDLNQQLWEILKFYFTTQRDFYAVDDVEKTLTRVKFGEHIKGYDENGNKIIEPSSFLYYYDTGSQTRPYEGRDKYGLYSILGKAYWMSGKYIKWFKNFKFFVDFEKHDKGFSISL